MPSGFSAFVWRQAYAFNLVLPRISASQPLVFRLPGTYGLVVHIKLCVDYIIQLKSCQAFQERFKITDSEWNSLFQNGWFPFITLNNKLINSIINHNRESWNVDDLLPEIQRDVSKRLPDRLKIWARIKAFEPHMDFISKAAEHYQKKDPISCISVLFPRIEGIMRDYQSIQGQPEKSKRFGRNSTSCQWSFRETSTHSFVTCNVSSIFKWCLFCQLWSV